jgi:hypothetical protein
VIFTKNIRKTGSSVKVSMSEEVGARRGSRNILFSGFLVTLLGASGVSLDSGLPPVAQNQNQTTEVSFVECQKELPVVTHVRQAVAPAGVTLAEAQSVPPACTQIEVAAKVLVNETTLAPVLTEELPAVIAAKKAEEEAKAKRVAAIEKLLKGSPMTEMAPVIAEQDTEIAALIVGIARKESQWGVRSPRKNGADCFNYWGFKGAVRQAF